MKTKLLKLVPFLIFSAFLSCNNSEIKKDIEKIKSDVADIKQSQESTNCCAPKLVDLNLLLPDSFKEKKIDLLLKFDCDSEYLQPVHLDLQHGFGLLCNTELDGNNNIKNMTLKLKEAEPLSRYDLIKAEYRESKTVKGSTTHYFDIVINTGSANDMDTTLSLKNSTRGITLKSMNKGDLIDFHIISDDPTIESKEFNYENFVTKFGQQFCKSVISNP